ncbi:hypothetical protein FRB94_002191 [Tulasnella sp. JGI-2019a]|nr:hypothetical protein FRB94_002191 [Tulasnella sp. JGI-2019a]KAG9029521.1 hypothetical protein FRB95_005242 [Tulasnella sp. JGI-2019a]
MSTLNYPRIHDAHGRSFCESNQAYTLPVDKQERERLDGLHELIRAKYRGLYLRQDDIRRVLAVRSGYTPMVLDIGTGSGVWAIEMAREFPHAQVMGIDLVSPILKTTPPPNCRFESHDINHGLDQFGLTFDVINIRCVDQGIVSQVGLVSTVAKALRPGGVFLSLGGSLDIYDAKEGLVVNKNEDEPGFSWTAKFFNAYGQAVMRRCPSVADVPHMLNSVRKIDDWQECGGDAIRLPIGPWEQDENGRIVGEKMRGVVLAISQSIRPVLLSDGHPAEVVDLWIAKTFDELLNHGRQLYIEFHFVWAIKKTQAAP